MNSGPCNPPEDQTGLESPGGEPAHEANGEGAPLSENERRRALKSNPLPSFAMHHDRADEGALSGTACPGDWPSPTADPGVQLF